MTVVKCCQYLCSERHARFSERSYELSAVLEVYVVIGRAVNQQKLLAREEFGFCRDVGVLHTQNRRNVFTACDVCGYVTG